MKTLMRSLLPFIPIIFISGNMKSQIQYPVDRNEFFQYVIEAGFYPCNEELVPINYCNHYDSVAKDYLSRLHNPDNIIILSTMNVKPLQGVLDIKFKNFGFMDSFSSYFEFNHNTIPAQIVLKDKENNHIIGVVHPDVSLQLSPSFEKKPPESIERISWNEDIMIISGLSTLLLVQDIYEWEWYLEGEKLFINIGGKIIPAREYFEKKGDIKRVKWNEYIIQKYRK